MEKGRNDGGWQQKGKTGKNTKLNFLKYDFSTHHPMPRLLAGGSNHEHDTDYQSLTIERCYKNLFELNKNVIAWVSWMQGFCDCGQHPSSFLWHNKCYLK